MAAVSLDYMRDYLSRSMSSVNRNKLHGLLAEVDFRRHLGTLGFETQVSSGGWIVRSEARGGHIFAENAAVFFPESISPAHDYGEHHAFREPHTGLHTICATFHQLGIKSYACAARIDDPTVHGLLAVRWFGRQLGVPIPTAYNAFPDCVDGFTRRERTYNYLRYHTNSSGIPDQYVPEEFSKENLRVSFANKYFAEVSDLDGLFWGQERTYPLEIKEKTAANERAIGDYFGIDIGPFVKLAYYAAKRGNLHSMFVVREIGDVDRRELVDWWYITFETLAQYASWNFVAGGTNMGGGRSATVKIPKAAFTRMTAESLRLL